MNPIVKELRQIYCCKGAEFCRPTLEKAWKEIERLALSTSGQPSAPRNVPDSIIGNILDHWLMLPGDTRQDLKDSDTGFYNAMERLTDWIEENR